RVHDVVDRSREFVDVFTIDRRDEGAVETLDDFVGEEVAFVLDFLDFVGFVPDRVFRGYHLLEEPGTPFELVCQRLKVLVEFLLSGNQSEWHRRAILPDSVYTPFACLNAPPSRP